MKTGQIFTVERCLSGYIITAGEGLGRRAQEGKFDGTLATLNTTLYAFSHKEQVLTFLRKNLEFDVEAKLAKEIK